MTVSINSKAPLRRHGDVFVRVEVVLGSLAGQPLDAVAGKRKAGAVAAAPGAKRSRGGGAAVTA